MKKSKCLEEIFRLEKENQKLRACLEEMRAANEEQAGRSRRAWEDFWAYDGSEQKGERV